MGLFNKLRKGMKKQVAQMPLGGRAERLPVGPLTTRIRIENMLEDRLKNLPVPVEAPVMPRISMPKLPDFSNMPTPEPTPEPIYTPPVMVPNIPKIPNIDFSSLPKFDSQTTSGRPMIPKFGNINLR